MFRHLFPNNQTVKVYRNHYSTEGGCSAGFSFHPSKREAVAAARRHLREFAEQAEPLHETARRLEVPTRKAALVRWLNLHAEHPDNG